MALPRSRFLLLAFLLLPLITRATELPNPEAAKALSRELLASAQSAHTQYSNDAAHGPAEAARVRYVTSLTKIAYRYMDIEKGPAWDSLEAGWEALNAEISRYPMPKDADSKALTKLLVGKWHSPRHDYIYRANGTTSMIRGESNARWKIEGNQTDGATILLLNAEYFVTTSNGGVFFEKRISK